MPVRLVMGLDAEAAQSPHEDQVEFTVGQQRACAHTLAHAVGEKRCIGLLEPALWSEVIWICPDIRVYVPEDVRNQPIAAGTLIVNDH